MERPVKIYTDRSQKVNRSVMKKSLYQINQEVMEITSQLEEGEYTPELEAALLIGQNEFQEKGIDFANVIMHREDNVCSAEKQLKRIQDYIKSENIIINRLKDSISNSMQLHGIEKITSKTLTLSFRKSESIEIDNTSQLEERFLSKKITVSPDKTRIKDAIANGEIVTGARLRINHNLQIK